MASSEQDFQSVYGMTIKQLEDAFWHDAETLVHENHEGTTTMFNGGQHLSPIGTTQLPAELSA